MWQVKMNKSKFEITKTNIFVFIKKSSYHLQFLKKFYVEFVYNQTISILILRQTIPVSVCVYRQNKNSSLAVKVIKSFFILFDVKN